VDSSQSELVDLGDALSKDWQVSLATPPDGAPYDELLEALTRRIRHLLEHNLDRLMTALYILDVPEEHFREATASKPIDESAKDLARVVMAREMKRVETRRKYSRRDVADSDLLP